MSSRDTRPRLRARSPTARLDEPCGAAAPRNRAYGRASATRQDATTVLACSITDNWRARGAGHCGAACRLAAPVRAADSNPGPPRRCFVRGRGDPPDAPRTEARGGTRRLVEPLGHPRRDWPLLPRSARHSAAGSLA